MTSLPHSYIVSGAIILSFFCNGCTTSIIPKAGPSKKDITRNERLRKQDILLIEVNNRNLYFLGPERIYNFNSKFKEVFSHEKGLNLGIGDELLVSIWESSGDGLFSTTEKKQTDISVIVDQDGCIFIPYAGSINVLSKSVESIRKEISKSLEGIAFDPQVQVRVVKNASNTVITIGELANPGIYPIGSRGLRILEVLSMAGGSLHQAFETKLKLVREELIEEIQLDAVLAEPDNNIYLKAGDTLQLIRKPKIFTTLGAIRSQRKHYFENNVLSLSEAIAQSGGLLDQNTDSSGIFLFRFEEANFLRSNGILPNNIKLNNDRVPVIYQFNLSKPESLFYTTEFFVNDKDLVYVAAASAVEYNKFIKTFVQPILDVGRTGIVVSNELTDD